MYVRCYILGYENVRCYLIKYRVFSKSKSELKKRAWARFGLLDRGSNQISDNRNNAKRLEKRRERRSRCAAIRNHSDISYRQ